MDDAIPVSPLPRTGTMRDWESLRRLFRGRPSLDLGQSWREEREPLFAAGHVRLALSGMSLAVLATFRDLDVFNPVTHFNIPAFPHGDVFEIFLQPEGQAAYYEFHITPGGAILQLRWPEPMRGLGIDWTGAPDPLLPYKVSRWRIRAQTRETRPGWEVHAVIPLKQLFETETLWDGRRLRAHFSRYDHTRGRLRPVLSSTAPLSEADFHRPLEWHTLELRFH